MRGRNYKRAPDFTMAVRIDEPIDKRRERVRFYPFQFNEVRGKTAERIAQDIFNAIFDRKAEPTDIVIATLFHNRDVLKQYKQVKEPVVSVSTELVTP